MLTTSKDVLFPGHNHILITGADDDLEIGLFRVDSIVISMWIVAFLPSATYMQFLDIYQSAGQAEGHFLR